jgi:hypothetical protein
MVTSMKTVDPNSVSGVQIVEYGLYETDPVSGVGLVADKPFSAANWRTKFQFLYISMPNSKQ